MPRAKKGQQKVHIFKKTQGFAPLEVITVMKDCWYYAIIIIFCLYLPRLTACVQFILPAFSINGLQ